VGGKGGGTRLEGVLLHGVLCCCFILQHAFNLVWIQITTLCVCVLCCRRKDNLAARSTAKLENKKAKREKKLLRAGFEGRKSGFINAGKK